MTMQRRIKVSYINDEQFFEALAEIRRTLEPDERMKCYGRSKTRKIARESTGLPYKPSFADMWGGGMSNDLSIKHRKFCYEFAVYIRKK
jgi:hypothetical protein